MQATENYNVAHYWLCNYIERKGSKGFTNKQIKADHADVWNEVYAKAWKNIKESSRRATKKGLHAMIYENGKYVY